MDAAEAKELLGEELARWRGRSFEELAGRVDAEPYTADVRGASGARYGLEVEVFWDARPGGTLRVLAMIDDGGLRAWKPLSDDFLVAPDGSFVGEG